MCACHLFTDTRNGYQFHTGHSSTARIGSCSVKMAVRNTSLLTTEAAQHFISNKLGLDNPERRFSEDKLQLLHDIARAFLYVIPFQNVSLNAIPKDERRTPTVRENIDSVLSGHGGICWTMNTFMHQLLLAIGYDVICAICAVTNSRDPTQTPVDDHVITVVNDVIKCGDHYLVEVGFGQPCFRAVCIDFAEESPVFSDSFNTYKYTRTDNLYARLHLRNTKSVSTTEKWDTAYTFHLEPIDLLTAEKVLETNIYGVRDHMFNTSLRVVIMPGGKTLAMKDNLLLFENENKQLIAKELTTNDELLEHLTKYLPLQMCTDALQNLGIFCRNEKPKHATNS